MVPTKNSPADSEKPGSEKTAKVAPKKATAKQATAKKADSPARVSKKATGATDSSDASTSKTPTTKTPAKNSTTVPIPQSQTQLIFAGPDPELFKKFAPDADGLAPEKIVRKRQRQKPSTQEGAAQPSRASKQKEAQTTEPQRVKGSTRLEAKRQRRRDGRDQGRRKMVVTESEFLARRESVDRVMVVREKDNKTQIAVCEDGVVVEHYVAKSDEASLIGNVYLGRVQNVLPSMEAAFVDIGRGRNAVLYSGEVDWEAATEPGGDKPKRIEAALKTGDSVLVQVTKDPVGHKGARLTSQISLPGRYLVYVPGGGMNGISRKLPDTERNRLKTILKKILPETAGVIVRTAAEGATEEQLTKDVERLQAQWETLQQASQSQKAPSLLHSEPDLLVKIIRDVFNEDFHKLVIDGSDSHTTITEYVKTVAPDLLERVEVYSGEGDCFDHFRVTEGIHKALDRKVWLPSGGSLVIDRTEAMTVVDVNTGKFVGTGGNLEETVTKNNLEAAEEIARQLRLRDIGGIIVVDFIDMVLESNRDLVLRRLMECLSRDRTKHQVAEVTSLGLVQMTRKRVGLGLLETFSEPCEACQGRGVVVHTEPVLKQRSGSGDSAASKKKRPTKSSTAPAQATHQITDDARMAIAQIAAKTVGVSVGENGVVGASSEQYAGKPAEAEAPADDPIGLGVPLPVKKVSPRKQKEDPSILEAVLNALPEPPTPGSSRRRRRASTEGVVTPGEKKPQDAAGEN
jgi:ribonuclease E